MYYLIKQPNATFLGLNKGVKPFLVTCKYRHVAQNIIHHVDHTAIMQLDYHTPNDMYDPVTNTTLSIDNNASLSIPKLPLTTEQANLSLIEKEFTELLIYPLEKRTGLVIPYFLIQETDDELLYIAHVLQ